MAFSLFVETISPNLCAFFGIVELADFGNATTKRLNIEDYILFFSKHI